MTLEKIAKSTSRAPGEISHQSLGAENVPPKSTDDKKTIKNLEPINKLIRKDNTTKKETSSAPEKEPSTTQSQAKNEQYFSSEELKMRDEQSQTVKSLSLRESLPVETSYSMSLIDESAKHLHILMKSAAKIDQDTMYIDPRGVKAACEAAKQMTSLLKLKLDIMKEFRKK